MLVKRLQFVCDPVFHLVKHVRSANLFVGHEGPRYGFYFPRFRWFVCCFNLRNVRYTFALCVVVLIFFRAFSDICGCWHVRRRLQPVLKSPGNVLDFYILKSYGEAEKYAFKAFRLTSVNIENVKTLVNQCAYLIVPLLGLRLRPGRGLRFVVGLL